MPSPLSALAMWGWSAVLHRQYGSDSDYPPELRCFLGAVQEKTNHLRLNTQHRGQL